MAKWSNKFISFCFVLRMYLDMIYKLFFELRDVIEQT